MSFHSMCNLFNALILLTFVNYISSQVESNDSVKNRNAMIQGIDSRRNGIKYVINILNRIDESLADLEKSDIETAKRALDCSPIGGLPGADCEWNEMGEEAKAQKIMRTSLRNPGRKRRSLKKTNGI